MKTEQADTRYAIEIQHPKTGVWSRWGGETFDFKTTAELKAISLQDGFMATTRVVPIEGRDA